jgi:hypothetical protein
MVSSSAAAKAFLFLRVDRKRNTDNLWSERIWVEPINLMVAKTRNKAAIRFRKIENGIDSFTGQYRHFSSKKPPKKIPLAV